jgi:hypothetical protein
MKNIVLNLAAGIATLIFCANVQAKIWRVNNTGVPADFTTAQTAHDAAGVVNGDTVHFEPSGTSYGSISLQKRLVIIGNGYFLGSLANNSNAGLQANPAVSKLDNIYVFSGGSQSVITGISCGDVYIGYSTAATGVVFKRNWCNTIQLYTGSTTNCIVAQNYVNTFVSGAGGGSNTGVVISNNIIGSYVYFDANDSGIFTNNIVGTANTNQATITLTSFVVRNNIRLQATAGSVLTMCTVQNNMDCTGGSVFGNADGNLAHIDMANVFAGWPTIGLNSTDGRFALKGGSPAAGAGYGGADMGAILNTGNANNNLADTYVLSGMPNVPSVFKLDAPLTANTSTLNITVSTKTNN